MKIILNTAILVFTILASSVCIDANAGESLFAFSYTTDLLPQGEREIEQWLTWRNGSIGGKFNGVEGRTGYEYGLTDNFQFTIYAIYGWANAYKNGPGGVTTPPEAFSPSEVGPDDNFHATKFLGISVEEIYRLSSPYTSPLGIALYLEPTFGPGWLELETRLILQKNFLDDTLVLAANLVHSPESRLLPEDGIKSWQVETDYRLSLGASYRFKPNWYSGLEFLNEREFNGLGINEPVNNAYYLGPNIHYGAKDFFITATLMFQMPWTSELSHSVPGAFVDGYDLDNDFERRRFRLKAGFYF